MENWNIKEETGKQYVYVSKLGDDTKAKAYFGYSDTWQADTLGYSYNVGDCRRDSTTNNNGYIQYKARLSHPKGSTAPSGDGTNWEFDKTCFQEYLNSVNITYNTGDKTVYLNEHYVCNENGVTGAFNLTKWTKVIISNKDVPFLTTTVASLISNTYARFTHLSYGDYVNNNWITNINIVLGLGTFNENITIPAKATKFIGIDKRKTFFYPNINIVDNSTIICENLTTNIGANTRPVYYFINVVYNGNSYTQSNSFRFCVNTIFLYFYDNTTGYTSDYYYIINCIFKQPFYIYNGNISSTSVIKNNYFSKIGIPATDKFPLNSILDYNCYSQGIYINGILKNTSIEEIKSLIPTQNSHSILNSNNPFTDEPNGDYTLLDENSPLFRTGQYKRNIGATSIGWKKSELDVAFQTPAATYKNIKIDNGKFVRDQLNKNAVSSTNNTIVLDSSASSVNDEYINFRIKITAGTGIGQLKLISGYNGTTKTATISSNWAINPDNTSIYDILDGEVYSGKINFGRLIRTKSLNFNSVLLSNANGKYTDVIDWDVNSPSLSPKHTFQMNYSTNDSTWSGFKQFLLNEPIRVDSSGNGNGDVNFVKANQIDFPINLQYAYINFALRASEDLLTFSPLNFSPVVWYDAKTISSITKDLNGYISQINDLSGNNRHMIQNTPTNQPVYHPVDGFVFVDDYMSAALGFTLNQPFTVFAVWGNSTSTVSVLFSNTGGGKPNLDYWNGTIEMNDSSVYNKTAPFSTMITHAEYGTGGANVIYENNVLKASVSQSAYSMSTLFLGSTSYGFEGNIKEFMILPGTLTSEQRTQLYSYALSRH